MPETKSAKVRSQLKHPIIDADGHWLEVQPVFMDYLAEVAGPKMADRYRDTLKKAVGYNSLSSKTDYDVGSSDGVGCR